MVAREPPLSASDPCILLGLVKSYPLASGCAAVPAAYVSAMPMPAPTKASRAAAGPA